MNINDVTALSEGRLSHPRMLAVNVYSGAKFPSFFKVLYVDQAELESLKGGLSHKQWYEAWMSALRFTAHWPTHMFLAVPADRLQAMIADVLIVEL